MEKNFTNIEQLDAYQQGVLSVAERQAFEQRLETDPAFREEFEAYTEMLGGIQTAGDLELRQLIRQAHAQAKAEGLTDLSASETQAPSRRVVSMSWYSQYRRIAAAAAILIMAAVGWWWYAQPSSYDRAFATHYTPEKIRLGQTLDALEAKGLATPDDPPAVALRAALHAYEKGDMRSAQAQLKAYTDKYGVENEVAQFYLGATLLAQNEYPKAAVTLKPLAENTISSWQAEARFYLALAYCKIDTKHTQATQLLQEIAADTSSPYQATAKRILQSL